jgi:SAM-dependent methyltransferase
MHIGSYVKMEDFVNRFLKSKYENQEIDIIDIGSQDVNGTYKPLFDQPKWHYTGCDMVKGKNVDLVLSDSYHWKNVKSNSFDVVISGQTFEHIEYFWVTMLEITRILKPGGMCCLIAPSNGVEHKYPVDCWRYYPDGFRALAKFAALELVDVYTQWGNAAYEDGSGFWNDTVLICRKPHRNLGGKIRLALKNKLCKFSLSL